MFWLDYSSLEIQWIKVFCTGFLFTNIIMYSLTGETARCLPHRGESTTDECRVGAHLYSRQNHSARLPWGPYVTDGSHWLPGFQLNQWETRRTETQDIGGFLGFLERFQRMYVKERNLPNTLVILRLSQTHEFIYL